MRVPYGNDARWLVPHDLGMPVHRPLSEAVDAADMSACWRDWASYAGALLGWRAGMACTSTPAHTDGRMKFVLRSVGQGTVQLCLEHLLPQPISGPQEFAR